MSRRRFIPRIFFVVVVLIVLPRQDDVSGQAQEFYDPAGPYFVEPPGPDCSEPKPIFIPPPSTTWVQPVAPIEMVPIMPLPQSIGPQPEMLPTPMFGGPESMPGNVYPSAPTSPLANIAPGGAISPQFGLPSAPDTALSFANPIMVPAVNDEFAWEQIADVVSDYFPIAREQQVRRSGEAWSEGRIETRQQGGASWLEPFRKDSVGSFNRWESTFQTIRRSAVVRVIPDANGFLVEVVVQKEIEDLPRPERAMAGSAAFRFDQSLPTDRADQVSRTLSSPRWLPLGRDPALEARMLADIHARLSGVTTAASPSLWP